MPKRPEGNDRAKLKADYLRIAKAHGEQAVLQIVSRTNGLDPKQTQYIVNCIATGKEDISQLDTMVTKAQSNTLKISKTVGSGEQPPPAQTTVTKPSTVSAYATGTAPPAAKTVKPVKPAKKIKAETGVVGGAAEAVVPQKVEVTRKPKKTFPPKMPEHSLYNRAARSVLRDTGRKSVGKTLGMLRGAKMKGTLVEQAMTAKEALDTAESVQNFPLAKYQPSVLNPNQAGGGPTKVPPKTGFWGKAAKYGGLVGGALMAKSYFDAATGSGMGKVASAEKQLLQLHNEQKLEEATMRFQMNEPELYQSLLNLAAGVPPAGGEITQSEVRYGGNTANVAHEDVPRDVQHAMIEGLLDQ